MSSVDLEVFQTSGNVYEKRGGGASPRRGFGVFRSESVSRERKVLQQKENGSCHQVRIHAVLFVFFSFVNVR